MNIFNVFFSVFSEALKQFTRQNERLAFTFQMDDEAEKGIKLKGVIKNIFPDFFFLAKSKCSLSNPNVFHYFQKRDLPTIVSVNQK